MEMGRGTRNVRNHLQFFLEAAGGQNAALLGGDESVFGQRSAGRMTVFATSLTVKHLALFAKDGGRPLARAGLAQLTELAQRFRLDELVDDGGHGPVAR